MFPHPPVVVGLTLCHDVKVDHPSLEHTAVRCFTRLRANPFPANPPSFCVFATLTDGEGEETLTLTVTRQADQQEEVRRIDLPVRFPDRLHVLRCIVRVSRCGFPAPGVYLFTLFMDGEWLAQSALHVLPLEAER
jgi:hypothetical protein